MVEEGEEMNFQGPEFEQIRELIAEMYVDKEKFEKQIDAPIKMCALCMIQGARFILHEILVARQNPLSLMIQFTRGDMLQVIEKGLKSMLMSVIEEVYKEVRSRDH